jgi:hypothetical protein
MPFPRMPGRSNPRLQSLRLQAQIERGQLIAIVGAGVSIGATDRNQLASWTGLLEDGVNRCCEVAKLLPAGWRERVFAEIRSGDPDDLLSGAEKVSRKLGRLVAANTAVGFVKPWAHSVHSAVT